MASFSCRPPFSLTSSSSRPLAFASTNPTIPLLLSSSFPSSSLSSSFSSNCRLRHRPDSLLGKRSLRCLPGQGERESDSSGKDFGEQVKDVIEEAMPTRDFVTLTACVVGLLTGVAIVLFNNAVHEIRDIFWDGIPSRGASWLREEPLEEIWQRVILVPVCGGVIVGIVNTLRSSLEAPSEGTLSNLKGAFRPFLKAVAASITLGTGNSLGPEGPSVEIGSAIAKGVVHVFRWQGGKRLALVAAGSAAGISSGFNAAVSGCFFAVESVLWPSTADAFFSISNSTPMVILSSVIASVVSEVGLGSDPAFTVPTYDFRSPSELPLYLLLGILCGLVSVTLSGCTSIALEVVENFQRATGIPKAVFPAMGGLSVGLIALVYPEVLYWGFENVDILLESRPFTSGLSYAILFQLVGVKILATSLCRASGLVGGYYAPSLFIGAATGMAYGKFVSSILLGPNPLFPLGILEVASPQAYGLVGMAATLAGVCQVPLTSVLLLFELTQDYRIVFPLLGAVGLSSWISSSQNRKRGSSEKLDSLNVEAHSIQQPKDSLYQNQDNCDLVISPESSDSSDLCKLESSLCVYDAKLEVDNLAESLTVSHAMRTKYISILMKTSIVEAVTLMLKEKQSFVVIIDDNNFLLGLLALEDIHDLSRVATATGVNIEVEEILVSHVCQVEGDKLKVLTATPDMTLRAAERIMDSHGVNELPVVSEHIDGCRGRPIGIIDRECISIACRVAAAKEFISLSSLIRRQES
ncbi:chloride channel protein CLC-e [Typha latifolia]|uniref:chloride channel protein CLC-e n=1 Tax=Typha latifolia TaxID=4733 RepID=UPI003C2FFF42